jgi:MFS transporter, OFA family, oxalate/formate antiporter
MSDSNLINSTDDAFKGRWGQLGIGLICMMAISSPQYVWALFTKYLTVQVGATLPELQVTFSILIVLQTFFSPFQGYLVDRFGPRLLLTVGAVLTGASWVLASQVTTLLYLYLSYGVLGGLGTGIIYVGVVGLMVRWFPTSRGFAAGVVAAGYGFGAVLTTFPISSSLSSSGFPQTIALFGCILGIVGIVSAQGMKRPPRISNENVHPINKNQGITQVADVAPVQMLKTPVFWLMFIMMSMMSTSGLMVISQMGAFSKDFGVATTLVWGMAALPLALTVDRFTNGLTRPFFGWVSDQIGRENTMAIAFTLEALAMLAWLSVRSDPLLFVILSGVVFFGWGEIFSLFPSTLTDTFGTKNATTNYGFLYVAQGVGSVLGGPVAALVHQSTGAWEPVFYIMVGLDFGAAFLAFFVLKSMRKSYLGNFS